MHNDGLGLKQRRNMTTSTNNPLVWMGRKFYAAAEIGFNDSGTFVLSLYSYKPPHEKHGNYFTTIPISEAAYRDTAPTKAAYCDQGKALVVYDDWGAAHRIEADRKVLDALCDECRAQKLPLRPNVQG
jgi:hypothetical protein